MPSPKQRSRSFKRKFVKTASSVKVHYNRRKSRKAKCPECGKPLKGTAMMRATKLKTLSKTEKRSSRKFANFCSSCSRKNLIKIARDIKW